MADTLIHLPVPPAVHIHAFQSLKTSKSNTSQSRLSDTSFTISPSLPPLSLAQSNTFTIESEDCILSDSEQACAPTSFSLPPLPTNHRDRKPRSTHPIQSCHSKAKNKDNVVHLTNLNVCKWSEGKLLSVLKQINPYWAPPAISIYMLPNHKTGLLTASVQFKSRQYSEMAMHLIQAHFHLFTNPDTARAKRDDLQVTGIKLKLLKPSLSRGRFFTWYAQQCIPIGFDLGSIIRNHYSLHCQVSTKLELRDQVRWFHDHIPNQQQIYSFLASVQRKQEREVERERDADKKKKKNKVLLSIFLPLVTFLVCHDSQKFYVYIQGTCMQLFDAETKQKLCERQLSPADIPELRYLDVLNLIDSSGKYTFRDLNNHCFELDLHRPIAHDVSHNHEMDLEPFVLHTFKLEQDHELDRCVICLQEMRSSEFVRIDCCKHVFHYNCIVQMLRHSKERLGSQVWDPDNHCYSLCDYAHCPLCRRRFRTIQSRAGNGAVQCLNVIEVDLEEHESHDLQSEESSDPSEDVETASLSETDVSERTESSSSTHNSFTEATTDEELDESEQDEEDDDEENEEDEDEYHSYYGSQEMLNF